MKNILLSKLFGNTERTIVNWRLEERPIIRLIEECFTDDEVEKFIENGTIPSKTTSLTVNEHYPLIKRSLKTRLEEFRENIGFQDTAYIKYLLVFWREIISEVEKNCDSGNKKDMIIRNTKEAFPKFSLGDMANFEKIEKIVKDRISVFYDDLSEIEIEFICTFPKEYEEIIHSSFTKFELLMLRLPPSSL